MAYDMRKALGDALRLEADGWAFYRRCADATRSESGKEMFKFLSGEEKKHYEKVNLIYRRIYGKDYSGKEGSAAEGIFEKDVPGGHADAKADELDALNIGIHAEDKSIELYGKLAEEAGDEDLRSVFLGLAKEEESHKAILEKEVESVTGTGAYSDFRVVTT